MGRIANMELYTRTSFDPGRQPRSPFFLTRLTRLSLFVNVDRHYEGSYNPLASLVNAPNLLDLELAFKRKGWPIEVSAEIPFLPTVKVFTIKKMSSQQEVIRMVQQQLPNVQSVTILGRKTGHTPSKLQTQSLNPAPKTESLSN